MIEAETSNVLPLKSCASENDAKAVIYQAAVTRAMITVRWDHCK
jgi:hypothetical protein